MQRWRRPKGTACRHRWHRLCGSLCRTQTACRGISAGAVARLPDLPATRRESLECAGQRLFAALDATGRRAAWVRPVERLGRTYADIFAVATPAFSHLARVLRLSGGWAYAAGSGAEATVGIIRDKPCREASLPDEIRQALGLPHSIPIRRL
jgi:hypothetical protein